MPRYRKTPPPIRHHKNNGTAYVTLHGKAEPLGKWDGREPKPLAVVRAYAALIRDWNPDQPPEQPEPVADLAVEELIALYWTHAQTYYRKNGNPTKEQSRIKAAMSACRAATADVPGDAFGIPNLIAVRDELIRRGYTTDTVNAYVAIVVRMFRWGSLNGHCRAGIRHELADLPALEPGRSDAPDTDDVEAVGVRRVLDTLPSMSPVARDICRFIGVTGCRPGEAVIIRARDIKTHPTRGIVYEPGDHKNKHHERRSKKHRRIVELSEHALAVLKPYRDAAVSPDTFLFSPLGESKRGHYTECAFAKKVREACDRAFPAPKELRYDGRSRKPRPEGQREALAAHRETQRWGTEPVAPREAHAGLASRRPRRCPAHRGPRLHHHHGNLRRHGPRPHRHRRRAGQRLRRRVARGGHRGKGQDQEARPRRRETRRLNPLLIASTTAPAPTTAGAFAFEQRPARCPLIVARQ